MNAIIFILKLPFGFDGDIPRVIYLMSLHIVYLSLFHTSVMHVADLWMAAIFHCNTSWRFFIVYFFP